MRQLTHTVLYKSAIPILLATLCATVWAQASDPATDQLKAQKDLAELQKQVAEAQKAQSEAELAAAKAKFGDLKDSGIGGSADITSANAGMAEGLLLGSKAVDLIAKQFVNSICKKSTPIRLVMVTSASVPDFQLLTAFEAQHTAIATAVRLAETTTGSENLRTEAVALLAAALPFVSSLLSYAKTDYKFIAIAVESSDDMLLRAMASRLTEKGRKVEIPAVFLPTASTASSSVQAKIGDLDTWSIRAKKLLLFYGKQKEDIEKVLAKTPDDKAKKDELAQLQIKIATWQAVSESIEAWSKKLATTDDKGNSAISSIVRQAAIRSSLQAKDGAGLLVVQLHKVAATGYSKKNLWSSLGANPFYVMGGAVASYVLVDGISGEVISSRLLPFSGGFHSVSDLESTVNPPEKEESATDIPCK